jgi:thioredoxin reductase
MRNQYIAVNKKRKTDVLGMYAAGDVCRPLWQVAKAVGEARVAGLSAASYIRQKRSDGKTEAVE